MNVVIAGLLAVVLMATQGFGGLTIQALTSGPLVTLLTINVVLVIFNMLPAFPMDGGRILRAFLAMVLPYERATTFAARTGQVVAVLLGIAGFSFGFNPGLLLIAAFVFIAAQAELASIRRQSIYNRGFHQTLYQQPSWTAAPSTPQDADIVWVEESRPDSNGDTGGVHVVRYGYWRPK